MALATRCPTCSTVFRISTAQAAAKGGMVRCGQCSAVFNSLDALVRVEDLDVIEEVDATPPPAAEAGPPQPAAEATGPLPAGRPAEPPAATSDDAGAEAAIDDGAPAKAPAAIEAGEPVVEPAADAASDEVADGGDAPRRSMSEWWLPERAGARANEAPADEPAEAVAVSDERVDHDALLSGRRTDLQWNPAPLESTQPTFMRPDAALPVEGRTTRWVYGLLSLGAAVALLTQAAYLWRDELAVRWSPAKAVLTAACRPFGCRVDYPARAEAITIESASVQTSGPNLDVYVLTALLRNRDTTDVRYPHLELVLTDLQDRPILRRALRPEDYLPVSRPASGFAAESELPIRVMFELSGLRFAGYRLDRFYP